MTPAGLLDFVRARFREAVSSAHAWRGDATVILRREALLDVARFLRDDPSLRMNFLTDLTAVDWSAFGQRPTPAFFDSSGVGMLPQARAADGEPWPGPPEGCRFAVVYHFYSATHKHRLRLVVPVPRAPDEEAAPEVDSLASLWPGADWLEREVWDMFGVRFRGHPGLKRILLYEQFEGHPLRKDYPVNKRQPLIGPVN
jgi:NADH-quinone oxidoreductase subunit C